MQPADVIRDFVAGHEGGYQNLLQDRGNIVFDRYGKRVPLPGKKLNVAARRRALSEGGRVIGTMRGVTPDTYARFLLVPVETLDEARMQAISEDLADEIGVRLYYEEPGINRLPWGPITAILVDMGWGCGPVTAIQFIQRRIGARVDGNIGPDTIEAWNKWIEKQGVAKAATDFANWKIDMYRRDVARNPEQGKWLQGWINRANYFKPENWEWWSKWDTESEVTRNASGDMIETRVFDGAQRRLDVDTAPAVQTSKQGIWAAIGSAFAGLGYMASTFIKSITEIFPQWMWGAIGIGAAIFCALYFTGIIRIRKREHKEWKH
jgi:lysozyme family protein